MSADNGIYVFRIKPGCFAVFEAQAIENLSYSENSAFDMLRWIFRNLTAPYTSIEAAVAAAHKKEAEIVNSPYPILEYGVSVLGFSYDDLCKKFPKLRSRISREFPDL